MKTFIYNARVILRNRIIRGYVRFENGVITAVEAGAPAAMDDCRAIDAEGRYLAPGFVELHTHGAGGHDFMDGTVEGTVAAVKTHLMHGTTCILPTSVACPDESLVRALDCFEQARNLLKDAGPELPGMHLEGPYLNQAQKGAIDPRYIKNPDPAVYMPLLERYGGAISRWTIAPELPGALEMGDELTRRGIMPSMGHSDARYEEVLRAYEHGFTHVTHLYSAVSTIVRVSGFRKPGLLESAFIIEPVTVELIADGCHLPIELLQMVYRIKGPDRICLVCDSIRCAGIDVKESVIGGLDDGQPIVIEDGVAKLPDRSAFAGSIATDDRLIRVMHCDAGIPLTDCVAMMSTTPARLIGLGARKGSIAVGKDADLVLFDDEICVSQVFCKGKSAWERGKSHV